MLEALGVPTCLGPLRSDSSDSFASPTGVIAAQKGQCHPSHHGQMGCRVCFVDRALILPHLYVQNPLQAVFDLPVLSCALRQAPYCGRQTGQEDMQLARGLVLLTVRVRSMKVRLVKRH